LVTAMALRVSLREEIKREIIMLQIEVCEIKRKCPVYKVGYKMTIDKAKFLLDRTDAICIHALSTLLHYVVALDEGTDPCR